MSQKVALVPAEKSDIPTLLDFLSKLFSLETDFKPDRERQTEGLRLILKNSGIARIYKVMINSRVAGMIVIHFAISTAEGGWSGRIEDLYLLPEFRGRGIGTEVVMKIIEIAKTNGLSRITLQADKDNVPALNFYEHCGFEKMNMSSLIIKNL